MRRSSHHAGNSLQIAFIFVCSIVLLFIAGMLLKFFLVLNASTFDGTHQYIVAIKGEDSQTVFVSYNPSGKSVNVLRVKGKSDDQSAASYLGLPIDASIRVSLSDDVGKMTENMVFHPKNEEDMTVIDALRLMIFVNTLNATGFHASSLTIPTDDKTKEKALSSLFLDQALYAENESVAIINATGESGVGSKVAHMLSTIGVNVVSVTTAENNQDKSVLLATQDNTYTVKRISRIFHVGITKKTQTISDITLTLGKDSLSLLQ